MSLFCLTVHFVFTIEVVQACMFVCERKKGNEVFVKGHYNFFDVCVCDVCACVCVCAFEVGCRDG